MVLKTIRSALLTMLATLLLLAAVLWLLSLADPGFKQRLAGWINDYLVEPWVEQQPTVQRLHEELRATENALAQRDAAVEALRRAAASLEQELDALRAELEASSGRIHQHEATIEALRHTETKLNAELDALRSELEDARSRNADRKQSLEQERQRLGREFVALQGRLDRESQSKEVAIEQLRDQFTVIRVGDQVLFDTGSARLNQAGRRVMSLIAEVLNKFPDRPVRIEGHTDDRPIVTPSIKARYPTNWELSAARAIAAARYLQEDGGVPPSRLMPTGLADNRPVSSNATPEGRATNRRIEIVLLPPSESFPLRRFDTLDSSP